MGWEERMLAVEYDGEHHRTDPVRYAYGIRRAEEVAELGWTVIRIIKTDLERDVVRRLKRARSSKLL
jgi:very-short-patch-repair endonuclease